MIVKKEEEINGTLDIGQPSVDQKNSITDLGMVHVGRVESFFKPDKKTGLSPVDEMVGEEITPENTIVYICGYQGTIDGVIDSLGSRGFVTEHEKNPDGSFAIKFESYG